MLDKEKQMENPCSGWLVNSSWDNVTVLEQLPGFQGLVESFQEYPEEWKLWFTSSQPEKTPLPGLRSWILLCLHVTSHRPSPSLGSVSSTFAGDWEGKFTNLQTMLIVRSLRQDRVTFCVTTFIIDNLGVSFVEPPALDMKAVSVLHLLDTSHRDVRMRFVLTGRCRHCEQVVEESSCRTPLIFVLSPGVDPTGALLQLAETSGMKDHFHALSLGQGQAPIARRMIEEGVEKGAAASAPE